MIIKLVLMKKKEKSVKNNKNKIKSFNLKIN